MQINDHRAPQTCLFEAEKYGGSGQPEGGSGQAPRLQARFPSRIVEVARRGGPPATAPTFSEDQAGAGLGRAGPSRAVTFRVSLFPLRGAKGAEGRGRRTGPGRRSSPSIVRGPSLCSFSFSSLFSLPSTGPSSSSSPEAAFSGGRAF